MHNSRRSLAASIIVLALLLACLGLAACGGSSKGSSSTTGTNTAATSTSTTATNGTTTGTSGTTNDPTGKGPAGGARQRFNNPTFKRALAKFATCMRENGVNIPAPNTSGSGPIFSTKGIDTTSAQFKTAETKCSGDLRAGFRGGAGVHRAPGGPGAAGPSGAPGGPGAAGANGAGVSGGTQPAGPTG